MTIGTGIRVIGVIAFVALAAGPALSAVQPTKKLLAETATGAKRTGIEIVAPIGDAKLGTILFGISGKTSRISFGGPR